MFREGEITDIDGIRMSGTHILYWVVYATLIQTTHYLVPVETGKPCLPEGISPVHRRT